MVLASEEQLKISPYGYITYLEVWFVSSPTNLFMILIYFLVSFLLLYSIPIKMGIEKVFTFVFFVSYIVKTWH